MKDSVETSEDTCRSNVPLLSKCAPSVLSKRLVCNLVMAHFHQSQQTNSAQNRALFACPSTKPCHVVSVVLLDH